MTWQDRYEISIQSNNYDMLTDPRDVSFTLSENIYDVYTRGLLEINDATGIIQESLMTMKGSEVRIDYGIENEINIAEMSILHDRTEEEPVQFGVLSSKVVIPLIHRWYENQQIISNAYRSEISTIVKNIVRASNYFQAIDIETTNGTDIWYQCLTDDVTFIEDQLLPNAFSLNADSTPYCAYSTNDRVFHFIPMKTMFNANVSATLDYSTRANIETISENAVMSIRRIKDVTDFLGQLSRVAVYQINRNTGRLEFKQDRVTNHVLPGARNLPYMGDISTISSYIDLDYVEPNSNQENNNTAQMIFNQRKAMFLDRFSVLIPFNPGIRCGEKIQLNIDSSLDESQSKSSRIFSGQYISEAVDHIWNGEENTGYTRLLIGRKYISVPDSYDLKGLMAR